MVYNCNQFSSAFIIGLLILCSCANSESNIEFIELKIGDKRELTLAAPESINLSRKGLIDFFPTDSSKDRWIAVGLKKGVTVVSYLGKRTFKKIVITTVNRENKRTSSLYREDYCRDSRFDCDDLNRTVIHQVRTLSDLKAHHFLCRRHMDWDSCSAEIDLSDLDIIHLENTMAKRLGKQYQYSISRWGHVEIYMDPTVEAKSVLIQKKLLSQLPYYFQNLNFILKSRNDLELRVSFFVELISSASEVSISGKKHVLSKAVLDQNYSELQKTFVKSKLIFNPSVVVLPSKKRVKFSSKSAEVGKDSRLGKHGEITFFTSQVEQNQLRLDIDADIGISTKSGGRISASVSLSKKIVLGKKTLFAMGDVEYRNSIRSLMYYFERIPILGPLFTREASSERMEKFAFSVMIEKNNHVLEKRSTSSL